MKKLFYNIIKKLLPKIFNWLKNQADNNKAKEKLREAGKLACEIDAIKKLLNDFSKDGVIDKNEMEKLAPELAKGLVLLLNLLGLSEIKIKNK